MPFQPVAAPLGGRAWSADPPHFWRKKNRSTKRCSSRPPALSRSRRAPPSPTLALAAPSPASALAGPRRAPPSPALARPSPDPSVLAAPQLPYPNLPAPQLPAPQIPARPAPAGHRPAPPRPATPGLRPPPRPARREAPTPRRQSLPQRSCALSLLWAAGPAPAALSLLGCSDGLR